ncbi:twin-arginine translocase TatA/TatE family subunit [bacterium]|jgi:sec-independent protein translocase protein TatA|nr:twin-arginine translocase TatA/TatE family subunit [bacterium]
MFGSTEIIIILLIVFVLFGASAIPKFARSIGQAKKAFDSGLKEELPEDAPKAEKKDSK